MSLIDMLLNEDSANQKYAMLQSLTGGTQLGSLNNSVSTKGGPRGWINEALDITNSPDKWADPLYDLMMRESGGDPNARNSTAVASGEHAQGLFQTIPSTFEAHNLPRLGGINDPVANAVAAIRYIIGRYGSPYNLPASGGY